MLYKVLVQKLMVGIRNPTAQQIAEHRRCYVVEAKSAVEAEAKLRGSGEPLMQGIVEVLEVPGSVVLLHP